MHVRSEVRGAHLLGEGLHQRTSEHDECTGVIGKIEWLVFLSEMWEGANDKMEKSS